MVFSFLARIWRADGCAVWAEPIQPYPNPIRLGYYPRQTDHISHFAHFPLSFILCSLFLPIQIHLETHHSGISSSSTKPTNTKDCPGVVTFAGWVAQVF